MYCAEGCTLTANEAHGIRFCNIDMVKKDLEERKISCIGLNEGTMRNKLEFVLREEEEWLQMGMYRRDTRFSADVGLDLERTVLDMLHCPMRMHEKVLNLLYQEVLNGKTKNEVNGKPVASKRKKKAVDEGAVGQEIAKLFENAQGLPELHRGVVTNFVENGRTAFYTVSFDQGTVEQMDRKEFREAHKLALLLETDEAKEATRKLQIQRKIVAPALSELSDIIRTLGSLGETWTHQWDDTNTKALKGIKLPYDQSKRIFQVANLPSLRMAVEVAVPSSREEHRKAWMQFLEDYVHVITGLTQSEEFTTDTLNALQIRTDKCYRTLLQVAGIKACTNYFHYLGSGHIVWLTKKYGNLWRFRNEGAESQNGTLSLRYNKFNNRGGNKGNNKKKEMNGKCLPFQVLGAWMARLSMWHLGLGDALFTSEIDLDQAFKDERSMAGLAVEDYVHDMNGNGAC
jgi:hypothetical protein